MGKRKRERQRGIERGIARCATRRAINVNHLADAQFNKKGHYDHELEVTSARIPLSLSLFLSCSFIYSKVYKLSTILSKKIQFVAHT